jgi:aspartate kinase
MKPQVVMKFGGTSVGTADNLERTCGHIQAEARSKLVVLSAVGGVTDLLLQAAGAASAGLEHASFLREIRNRHFEIVKKLGLDELIIIELDAELERLLVGVSMLHELSSRVQDALLSLGERTSVRLMAGLLSSRGEDARAFDAWDLGMLTDDQHGRASPLADAPEQIRTRVKNLPADCLPVVTGFIGHSPQGVVTTLGRGGSDYSAAVFGAAVGAEEIQIWTDVPGFLRADPRAVEDPALIPAMRFDEAAELAYFGAKVLHPRTIEPARESGIPVRVLGTFHVSPSSDVPIHTQGTLIHDDAPSEAVRALALQKQVESLTIHSLGMLEAPGFLARVFEIFARHCISIDVVATSEVGVSLTFDRAGLDLEPAVSEIAGFAEVSRKANRSIVCLVGAGLKEDTRLLGRVFTTLGEAGIPVAVVSQGGSRINVTLVTDPPHGAEAMRVLHRELF